MEEQKAIIENEKETNKGKRNKKRMLIVSAFLILVILICYIICRGSYLETLELGENYLQIFWENFNSSFIAFGIHFLVLYILIYFTNKRIKRGLMPFFQEENKPIPKMINKSIAFIVSIIISLLLTNTILEKWKLCAHMTGFGINDPVLGYDIGYFVFAQPFLQLMIKYLLILFVGLTVYTVLYYIVAFNIYFDGVSRETLKNSKLKKQICTNLIVVAFLISTMIIIESFNVGVQNFISLDTQIPYYLTGAGVSEVTIKMWGYRILAVIILVSVIFATHYFKKSITKKVITSLAVVPAYLILMLVVLLGFNLIFVSPNELDKQQDYIKANIESTKKAYGIEIEQVSLPENEMVTANTLSQNSEVISNIAFVDKDAVLKDLNTLQTNKGYYTYPTSQITSYRIKGEPRLVYISPREITNVARTYNNKTYEYTHGYGIIATMASSVDKEGNLIHLQKDFSNTNEDIVSISQPRIYFGLETNDTIVTNANEKSEFDYPIVDSNKTESAQNTYDGKAGLELNFLDRLILAIRKGNLALAFSGNVNSQSKILINRNIIERAKILLPDILYDDNPYLVMTEDGDLVWVLDGYTTTNLYPYSQKTVLQGEHLLQKKEINYIRNSVKVLVDAYDGTIEFYITNRDDPIIMAYQKIYPSLFMSEDAKIPETISDHFVYPKFLYNIQAQVIKYYHNTSPDVLYRGYDIWSVAMHNTTKNLTNSGTEITPYYTMVKTVKNEKSRLGLVLPYTQYAKQNLIAYLIGSYENEVPKLALYEYASDSNILGPMQIDTQLEQDETISKQINSLNVTGTRITKNILMIPIGKSLLYVEPIYQQYLNADNSTPILKKVVVSSGNKVAIGDNLTEALENLVSQYAVDIEVENTDTIEDLIDAIIQANKNLQESSNHNSWEMVGKDMARLQELIKQLEVLTKQEKKQNEVQDKEQTENINEQILENGV